LLFISIFIVSFSCLCDADAQSAARKKEVQSLSERVQQLTELTSKRSVIKLTGDRFRQFVRSTPRNYSVIIMFTALSPQRQCLICRNANDEFQIVANSFRYSPTYSNKLFFALVDFDDGPDVFQSLKLNSAPVFMHFPAKGKPKKNDNMDIQRVGFGAEAIARWVNERTDIQIRIFRPPNYSGAMVMIALMALLLVLVYLRRNNLDFLYNTNTWAIAALVFSFAMTSGQMWNHIRGPPFVHKSQTGQVTYVHGSSQGQLVLETYIVILLNASVVVGMILLNEAATNKGEIKKRRVMCIAGLVLVVVFFSCILSLFRAKAHGYPYSFLFK